MKARRLENRLWLIVFDTGDEVIAGLKEFVRREGIGGARFEAIGAFSRVTLAFFDLASKSYRPIPIEEQVEVVSLLGNVARVGDRPKVHAHCVVGKSDGTARGGHLLQGHVRPTLELFLTEAESPIHRRQDAQTGLALIEI